MCSSWSRSKSLPRPFRRGVRRSCRFLFPFLFPLPSAHPSATAYLGRAPPSPDVASDRALVQRTSGQLSDALITLDGVLETAPRHAQALWNRALVLRDLGLPLSAAAAFDAVAALNEPGWS